MEKIISELFKEYYSDYFNYQVLIDSLTFILILGVNIGFGFFLNSRIEKVKLKNNQELSSFSSELNLLNKKSEIKFQKYQIEQADAIKELYSKLIDIKFSTNSLFNEKFYSSPHIEFKDKLDNWVKNYSEFYLFFYKNRIMFNEELLNLTQENFETLHKIFFIVFKKTKDIDEMEEHYYGQLEYLYNNYYEEEGAIIRDLKKMKLEMDNGVGSFSFNNLTTALENEYKKLLYEKSL